MDRGARQNFWLSHVTSWRHSCQSQATYCREHGLPVGTFHYWKHQANKCEADGNGANTPRWWR